VPDDDTLRRVLTGSTVWAVVGLRDNPSRPAYRVARFLVDHGKRVVPIHPSAETVHGQQGYATLADVPFEVEVVDVFRRSDAAGQFADEAVAIGARAVWFQLDVVDDAAARRVRDAGLTMVMDRCPAIEWPRLLGASSRDLGGGT